MITINTKTYHMIECQDSSLQFIYKKDDPQSLIILK